MRETVELRFLSRDTAKLLGNDVAILNDGGVDKVIIDTSSPQLERIEELHNLWKSQGKSLYAYWEIRRKYSKKEVAAAEFFYLRPWQAHIGEELCRTEFRDELACPTCKAGAPLRTALHLDKWRLPKKTDVFRTYGAEIVASVRLAELIRENGLTGCELRPVLQGRMDKDDFRVSAKLKRVPSGRVLLDMATEAGVSMGSLAYMYWLRGVEQTELLDLALQEYNEKYYKPPDPYAKETGYFQLVPCSQGWRIAMDTTLCIDYFDLDLDGKYRCPHCAAPGHGVGFNLHSELYFDKSTWSGDDITLSADYLGSRMGLYRPRRLMLLSKHAHEVLSKAGLSGLNLEIAHPA